MDRPIGFGGRCQGGSAMDSTMIHVCLETEGAPSSEGHEVGERWVCQCGDNFVYREGFTRAGHPAAAQGQARPALRPPQGLTQFCDDPARSSPGGV